MYASSTVFSRKAQTRAHHEPGTSFVRHDDRLSEAALLRPLGGEVLTLDALRVVRCEGLGGQQLLELLPVFRSVILYHGLYHGTMVRGLLVKKQTNKNAKTRTGIIGSVASTDRQIDRTSGFHVSSAKG